MDSQRIRERERERPHPLVSLIVDGYLYRLNDLYIYIYIKKGGRKSDGNCMEIT